MTSEGQTKVLLVEDESLVRWTAKRALEGIDCLVVEAESCMEAEEQWRKYDFDVAVLDYRLGDGKSVDVVERMRADGDKTPLIFLTAESDGVAAVTSGYPGVVAILTKPLELEELTKAVLSVRLHAALGGRQAVETGGFRLIACPRVLDAETLEHACKLESGSECFALLLEKTEVVDETALESLRKMANDFRGRKGRICIVGVSGELRRDLVARGMNREIDFVSTVEELRYLGRKSSSPSERSSLMDVPVRRNNAAS